MKSRLNCLLFREDFDLSNKILDGKVPTGNYKNDKIATIEDEEIWSKMEVIKTKTKRKGEHIRHEYGYTYLIHKTQQEVEFYGI
jgi:HKD family nuclease